MVKDTRGEGHTPLAKHAQDLTRDYVGLTCAACHTGDLKYNGERFLIHAGQSNLDYERFMFDLSAAVSKASQDPKGTGYFARMAAKGPTRRTPRAAWRRRSCESTAYATGVRCPSVERLGPAASMPSATS